MRKIFKFCALFLVLVLLSGCQLVTEDLEQKIMDLETRVSILEGSETPKPVLTDVEIDENEDEEENEEISDNYIRISSPVDGHTIYEEPIEFKGTVSPNTSKVVVTAMGTSNGNSEYRDVYTLESFKYGDGTFAYKAQSNFNNLSYGTNEYEFEAYFDDGSKESVTVSIFYLEN